MRRESMSLCEGMNLFLSLQSLDLFAGPNRLQLGLKDRTGFLITEQFVNMFS